MSSPFEGKQVAKLLCNIVEAVRFLFLQEDSPIYPHRETYVPLLNDLIRSLTQNELALQWNYDRYCKDPVMFRSVPGSSADPPKSGLLLGEREGSDLVRILCQCFLLIGGEDVIDKWATESLLWALSYKVG